MLWGMKRPRPSRRSGARLLPLLCGGVLSAWNPGAVALAGCAAGAPALISGPLQMPQNGSLSLVLSHPVWHSRGAATGTTGTGPLGSSAEDLPFVLLRNGTSEPLKLRATRTMPRGQLVVELEPAAGWVAGAAYELRTDVGTLQTYPPFSAVAGPDSTPPTWATQPARAIVVQPPPPPPPAKSTPVCVTKGKGKTRTTECTVTVSSSSSCPGTVTEAHVHLHLPAAQDDHGGVIMLEIRMDKVTTWVPAQSELTLGLAGPCDSPNFPPPAAKPYELLVTPVDAAHNRGPTLHVPVDPRAPRRR